MNTSAASIGKSWYLVYTKPGQERIAISNLERQGYQAYLPLAHNTRKRGGRRVRIVEPLFPRYLFIYLDSQTDNWGPIRSTLGVSSLVRFGREPAKVPAELIRFLKEQESEEGFHDWIDMPYQKGDRVHVVEGVFRGYEGILLAQTSRERVLILLNTLEHTVKTQLSMTHIERAR